MTRRVSAVVVAVAAVFHLAGPAAGHAIVTPNSIELEEESTVSFQVIGDLPTTTVEVQLRIPPQFEVTGVAPVPGWKVERTPTAIKLTGGKMISGGFLVLSVTGRSSYKGELPFPLIEVGDDGSTLEYTEGGYGGMAAPIVYSGVEYLPPAGTDDESAGTNPLVPVVVLGGGTAAAAAFVVWRRRRVANG